MIRFAALDFETADYGSDSACALGLTFVENTTVRDTVYRLIRPPRNRMMFTHIHGIRWADVAEEAGFEAVWSALSPRLEGLDFIAAHNASFDKRILEGCCAAFGLPMPEIPFVCTVNLSRALWNVRPTKLPDVCRHLCIPLNHHHAASDAEACARIVTSALEDGWSITEEVR